MDPIPDRLRPWIPAGTALFRAAGCDHCSQTGYRGRMGLYELLTVGEGFKTLVNKEPNLAGLRRHWHGLGTRKGDAISSTRTLRKNDFAGALDPSPYRATARTSE